MALSYKSIVPWGRSYDEYAAMFQLSEEDLDKNILGCGDGPASFNSIMSKKGKRVTSIDPIYQFSAEQVSIRIGETYEEVISQTYQNRDKFIWTKIKDVEDLGRIRMTAMKAFLEDYEVGKSENRYVYAELPKLPFRNHQFDLALSSHFLFLYSDHLTLDFHINAIHEMLRVAREVRIFPILDMNASRCPYVDDVIETFIKQGFTAREIQVDYEFQKGGYRMLSIK